jgi:hypothetical protein
MDNPTSWVGPDKQVPPGGEGHACHARLEERACHARGSEMDDRTLWVGPDKRVPPKGKVGGACLSRPRKPTPDQDETPLFCGKAALA